MRIVDVTLDSRGRNSPWPGMEARRDAIEEIRIAPGREVELRRGDLYILATVVKADRAHRAFVGKVRRVEPVHAAAGEVQPGDHVLFHYDKIFSAAL